MSEHKHFCHCGAYGEGHETGFGHCYREICEAPVELNNDWWKVEVFPPITGFSLREQRLYHKHLCGCWSRAKDGSKNSIET